jgi:hypothetical protein
MTTITEKEFLVGLSGDKLEQYQQLKETIATQQSLKTYPGKNKNTDAAAHALEVLMHLAPEERRKHLDTLQKSLRDHHNDGVSDGAAERNRQSVKNAQKSKKMPTLNKTIKAMFDEDEALSEEFKEAATELFEQTVLRTSAAEALHELMRRDPYLSLMFGDDDYLEEVAAWSAKVEHLEQMCAEIEMENRMLREHQMHKQIAEMDDLREEVLIAANPLSSRRSSRNLSDDFEADPDNAVLMKNNSQRSMIIVRWLVVRLISHRRRVESIPGLLPRILWRRLR